MLLRVLGIMLIIIDLLSFVHPSLLLILCILLVVPRHVVLLRLRSILLCLVFLVLLVDQLDVLLLLLILQSSRLLAVLTVDQDVTHLFGEVEVDRVVFNESLDSLPAVSNLGQLDEERDQVKQLTVLGVIVP